MNEPSNVSRVAKALSLIEEKELKATLVSMLMVFVLLASYYVLRPVRDAMASDWTDSEVAFLWRLNFFVSAALVSVFGLAVCKFRLKQVIAGVYVSFAVSFVLLYFGMGAVSDQVLIDKAFYLWVSVFALFNTSVFWTFMTDMFTKEQSKRLFAVITAGASAGALVGPFIPLFLVSRLGTEPLILIACVGLLLVVPLIFYLYHLKDTELGNIGLEGGTPALGGRWWQGFSVFAKSPYMLAIAAFMLLFTFISSFIYFEQKNLLAEFSEVQRTEILALIDWIVAILTTVLTFVLALFVTGRIVTQLGMPFTLALMPVIVCLGMLVLAVAPVILVVFVLQIVRRAGNYGVTRPAREMLYTKIKPEDRFKSKPVIDIVVYRGGDAAAASLFAILTDKIGLGLAAMAAIGSGIAALWAWVGIKLGGRFDEGENDVELARETAQASRN